MKIRYFIFLFGITVLFAGVSFASTLDPMIIFGNSPAGMAVSACTFPETCSTGLDATGSTPAEDLTGNLTFFNDTATTYESFTVTVNTPFFGPLNCATTASANTDGTFNTPGPDGAPSPDNKSCTFTNTVFLSLVPCPPALQPTVDTPGSCPINSTFDLQFVTFTADGTKALTALSYGFAPAAMPEPGTFVLLGTGLAALLGLSVGRKRFNCA